MDCKETASRLEAKNSNYGEASFAVRLNQISDNNTRPTQKPGALASKFSVERACIYAIQSTKPSGLAFLAAR